MGEASFAVLMISPISGLELISADGVTLNTACEREAFLPLMAFATGTDCLEDPPRNASGPLKYEHRAYPPKVFATSITKRGHWLHPRLMVRLPRSARYSALRWP